MNSINIFYIISYHYMEFLMLKLSKLYNKYSGNKYAQVEIQLNTC